MSKITVIIATHKKYQMPKDKLYLPLHVGAEGKDDIGYQKDNDGKNISKKNPFFCELTGLYWAWKNLDSDYIGLVHYRRYFYDRNKIIGDKKISKILSNNDIILPKKFYSINLKAYPIPVLYCHDFLDL